MLVSADDRDLLSVVWSTLKNKGYLYRSVAAGKFRREVLYLHRVVYSRVLGRPLVRCENVDHIDGDRANNQRENLRLATSAENSRNQKARCNVSGFKGVGHHARSGKWDARIRVDGRNKRLGLFDSVIDAAVAYDRAAVRYFAQYARTNFPLFALGLV